MLWLLAVKLLLLRWLLLLLLLLWTLTLVLLWAVLIYPALGRIAALCAHPAKWGPNVGFLVQLRSKRLSVLHVLLIFSVFGRHLRGFVAFLLEERIKVVLVLLSR